MFEDEDNVLTLGDDEEEKEEMPEEKPKSDMDDEVLRSMMMTGENTEGTFTPDEDLDEDEEIHEEIDEDASITTGKVREKLGKYSDEILFDMKENPDKYLIQTERGEMSIMEALKQGWNPATKEFDGPSVAEDFKKGFDGLSDSDRQALEQITDPAAAHIPPAEAGMYGLDPNDPMIDGQGMDPRMMQGAPQDPGMMDPNMGGMGGMM